MIITEDSVRFRILAVIGDSQAVLILAQTMREAKTVTEICDATQIPLSSTYRKISLLLEAGLLHRERIEVKPDGKKTEYYMSSVSEIRVKVKGKNTEVELIPTSAMMNRLWFTLFRQAQVTSSKESA